MSNNSIVTWIKDREPVIASAITKGSLAAVGGFAITHGWIGKTQDDTLIQVATPIVAGAVIVAIDWIVRTVVTPVAKVLPAAPVPPPTT